ncbi:NPCBM/NEW2 domain-containing protein [Sphaerisporangium flaviroseum]|uniref:Alpha-galactosidase n=1 Tax=Sphaerisporangium flaviroseum TaxID=509199 RepID=A0ABP7IWC5_9ACTN
MRKPGWHARAVAALIWSSLVASATFVPVPAYAAPPEPAAGPALPTPTDTASRGPGGRTLAATPPMGFNNWNAFGCDVNEALIKETADIFVSSGLKDAGYRYVNIDDCWSMRERGADGRLVPDPVKFPNGIKGVADYVHSKGLKLGIYGDAGTKTCAGYPGSLGVEDLDAQTWADWGVDYLKYDNCHNQSDGSREDYVRRYTAMRDAIDKTGRPIVYSICEWGTSQPWLWAEGVGHLWRTTGDISDNWSSLRSIIRQNAPLAQYAGRGHWNDPDMLEIGNGEMTDTEYHTHMSMWAMMAAPLIIGTDLRAASPETMAILGDQDIIAIDQDPLGVQGSVVSDTGGLMVLDKPLANGDRAIALYNSTDSPATVTVAASATGLKPARAYRLKNVWTGDTLQVRSTISAGVPAHGTVVYRVRPVDDPRTVPPAVAVGASLGTVVPAGGGTLTTAVTNRGVDAIRDLSVSAQAPAGWTVTPTTPRHRARLATDATLRTTWTIGVPEDTGAGSYPINVTAAYTWGPNHRHATTAGQIIAVVVTAPADGRRHLSTIPPVTSSNAIGPVETDQSNGGPLENDGALITIGEKVYTRGLGTTAAGEISYYVGGRCSRLVTDVGVDDEAVASGATTFTVYADDAVAATSGPMTSGEAAKSLTADLTGTAWLRLVTTSDSTTAAHTDWAAPVLTCGGVPADSPVLPVSQTLFSFESGTDDFTIANPGDGGTVAQSPLFHTDGANGLKVSTPTSGNWFGRPLAEPLDLSGKTMLKYDVKTGDIGTVGEIAIQVGDGMSWCQGGLWAWTNPNSSRTITERFSQIECPAGVTLDPSRIRAIWVFLNSGGEVHIDNLRAE